MAWLTKYVHRMNIIIQQSHGTKHPPPTREFVRVFVISKDLLKMNSHIHTHTHARIHERLLINYIFRRFRHYPHNIVDARILVGAIALLVGAGC